MNHFDEKISAFQKEIEALIQSNCLKTDDLISIINSFPANSNVFMLALSKLSYLARKDEIARAFCLGLSSGMQWDWRLEI